MCPKVTAAYTKEKLKRLLETAAAVFIAKGYEKTTMQDVVDACQISRGGLYKYFNSTEEILLALLEQDTTESEMSFASEMADGVAAEAIFEGFLTEQLQMLTSIHQTLVPVVYEYVISSRQSEKTQAWLAARRQRSLKALEGLIAYGIESKAFGNGSPQAVAAFVITFLEGLTVTAMTTAESAGFFEGQLDLLKQVVV